jgi:hypothetical protein
VQKTKASIENGRASQGEKEKCCAYHYTRLLPAEYVLGVLSNVGLLRGKVMRSSLSAPEYWQDLWPIADLWRITAKPEVIHLSGEPLRAKHIHNTVIAKTGWEASTKEESGMATPQDDDALD